jgi:hypothetical protein
MVFYMVIVFIITHIFKLAEKRYLRQLRARETTGAPELAAPS